VILINLLPHREAARKLKRERFYVMLGASALLGGLISGTVYLGYQTRIADQQVRNSTLKQEITSFDRQIKDIANLQGEIAALRARQEAVESLQADRNMPVHLLMELLKQLPDGVYINSLRQDRQSVVINGVAQSQDRISEMLRNISTNSPWLSKPELVEIVAGNVALSARDQRRVSNFTMRMVLAPVTPAAAGASAAAPKK
jgi:type IV pilus assembly protein PilN